jgi:hypothetical protein
MLYLNKQKFTFKKYFLHLKFVLLVNFYLNLSLDLFTHIKVLKYRKLTA